MLDDYNGICVKQLDHCFIIKGYDRRYNILKQAKEYARFDNRRDCYQYLDKLKRSFGEHIKFVVVEQHKQPIIQEIG